MILKELKHFLHDRNEVPDAFSYPKILTEIQKFKKRNLRDGRKPTILIASSSLPYVLTHESREKIFFGRRWSSVWEQWKGFFDALVKEGVELIFFQESREVSDASIWYHKYKRYLDFCQTIEDIKTGQKLETIKSIGHSLTVIHDYLIQNLKSYGQWIQVFDEDINMTMARYAEKNDVFAVLTNSIIEFSLFRENYRVWAINNIKFHDMTTKQLNRVEFRKVLGLFQEQMPLFAILCGVDFDIISEKKLEAFHNSFPEKERIKGIANYVKSVKVCDAPVNVDKVLKRIGCTKGEIEACLQKYEHVNNMEEFGLPEDSFTPKVNLSGKPYFKTFLKMKPILLESYFEDRRSPILEISQMELILYFHRCFLGIFFKEKNDPNLKYPLIIIVDHDKGYERLEVTPEYPPFGLPPMEQFLFDPNNYEITSIRLDLVKWCFKFEDPNTLNKIPDILVPIVLTLNFMIKEAKLKTHDADVILISFYDTIYNRKASDIVEKRKYPEIQPFLLSYYYLRIQNLIVLFLQLIGLDKWAKYAAFDGVYFHHLYKIWKDMDENVKNDRLKEIQHLRLYPLDSR